MDGGVGRGRGGFALVEDVLLCILNDIFSARSLITQQNLIYGLFEIYIAVLKFFLSPFIVPPVLLQTVSTLMSLLMACRRCIQ
jgi:hypothetical protein